MANYTQQNEVIEEADFTQLRIDNHILHYQTGITYSRDPASGLDQPKEKKHYSPVPYRESPNQSSNFDPRGIVLHDTAGRIKPVEATLAWFAKPAARASAHFTIDRAGTIGQSVPCNKAAWHAGRSSFRGIKGCNSFTFGIELVNPGRLHHVGPDTGEAWFGAKYKSGEDGYTLSLASTAQHGNGMWMDYTQEQIESCIDLCQELFDVYDLGFITTHWAVSPGRKIDTNPTFPLDKVVNAVLGRGEHFEEDGPDGHVIVNSNMRRWPSTKSKIVYTLPKHTNVDVIRSGWFDDEQLGNEQWHLCDDGDGHQGWIWSALVDLY